MTQPSMQQMRPSATKMTLPSPMISCVAVAQRAGREPRRASGEIGS